MPLCSCRLVEIARDMQLTCALLRAPSAVAASKVFNAKTNAGATALSLAASKGREEALAALLEARGGSATDGTPLGQPIKLNVADRNGLTAMHRAAMAGRAACVRMLLDAGADPERTDATGHTVLAAAAEAKEQSVVSLLLEWGADPGRANDDGATPAALALPDELLAQLIVDAQRSRGEAPPR